MRHSPERTVRDIEFQTVLGVGVLEMTRMAAQIWRLQALSTGTEFNAIHPAVNFILDYTGDFPLGYMLTWAVKDFIPKVSRKAKLNLATGLVLTGGLVLELSPLGTPADIPFLLLGVSAYRGAHWGLGRLFQTENTS